jgi:hypothetical protein
LFDFLSVVVGSVIAEIVLILEGADHSQEYGNGSSKTIHEGSPAPEMEVPGLLAIAAIISARTPPLQ